MLGRVEFLDGRGQANILKDFSVKRFSRGLNESYGVVLIGLELADGSLLMADRYKSSSRGAIWRLHSISSIILKKLF